MGDYFASTRCYFLQKCWRTLIILLINYGSRSCGDHSRCLRHFSFGWVWELGRLLCCLVGMDLEQHFLLRRRGLLLIVVSCCGFFERSASLFCWVFLLFCFWKICRRRSTFPFVEHRFLSYVLTVKCPVGFVHDHSAYPNGTHIQVLTVLEVRILLLALGLILLTLYHFEVLLDILELPGRATTWLLVLIVWFALIIIYVYVCFIHFFLHLMAVHFLLIEHIVVNLGRFIRRRAYLVDYVEDFDFRLTFLALLQSQVRLPQSGSV